MISEPFQTGLAAGPPSAHGREMTDAHLLQEFRATRSESVFAQIVARHGAMVFRTCLRLLGDSHEAEDATQAVFVVLVRRPQVAGASLPVWLHWLARNVARNSLRARTRRTRHEEAAMRRKPTTLADPAAFLLREELDAALARLSSGQREAVILRYLEGHTQEEAARRVGCPQGTLGRRSMEGLQRLRSILGRRGVNLSAAALTAILAEEALARLPVASLLPLKLTARTLASHTGSAAVLAESVLNGLFWAKARIAAAVALVIVLGAAGWIAYRFSVVASEPLIAPSTPDPRSPEPNEPLVAIPAGEAIPPIHGAAIATFKRPGQPTLIAISIAPSPSGRVSISAGGREPGEAPWVEGQRGSISCLRFSPDGGTLAAGSVDGTVDLWDPVTRKQRARLPGPTARVTAIAFSEAGTTLVTGYDNGEVRLWDPATGLRRGLVDFGITVTAIAVSEASHRIVTVHRDGSLQLFPFRPGQQKDESLVASRSGPGGTFKDCTGLSFSADGQKLVSLHWLKGVSVWAVAPGHQKPPLTRIATVLKPVTAACFTADGKNVRVFLRPTAPPAATAPFAQPLVLVDLTTGAERETEWTADSGDENNAALLFPLDGPEGEWDGRRIGIREERSTRWIRLVPGQVPNSAPARATQPEK